MSSLAISYVVHLALNSCILTLDFTCTAFGGHSLVFIYNSLQYIYSFPVAAREVGKGKGPEKLKFLNN